MHSHLCFKEEKFSNPESKTATAVVLAAHCTPWLCVALKLCWFQKFHCCSHTLILACFSSVTSGEGQKHRRKFQASPWEQQARLRAAALPRALRVENRTFYLIYEVWNKLEWFGYKTFTHACLWKCMQHPFVFPLGNFHLLQLCVVKLVAGLVWFSFLMAVDSKKPHCWSSLAAEQRRRSGSVHEE